MDFMKFDQSFEKYVEIIGDLKNKVEEISKLNQKKEQVELVNDILDAMGDRKEKVIYKTIVDDDTYQLIRNRVRREIVEECSKGIWAEIEDLADNLNTNLNTKFNSYDAISFIKKCKKNIMKIIGGE